jgi:hypothetical protein
MANLGLENPNGPFWESILMPGLRVGNLIRSVFISFHVHQYFIKRGGGVALGPPRAM